MPICYQRCIIYNSYDVEIIPYVPHYFWFRHIVHWVFCLYLIICRVHIGHSGCVCSTQNAYTCHNSNIRNDQNDCYSYADVIVHFLPSGISLQKWSKRRSRRNGYLLFEIETYMYNEIFKLFKIYCEYRIWIYVRVQNIWTHFGYVLKHI